MSRQKFLIPFIFFLLVGMTWASTRVAFSRPGHMIRIPNVDNSMHRSLLTLDVSSEILSTKQNGFAFSVQTMKSGYQYGLSFIKPWEPTYSVELGFHLQKNILQYREVQLGVGIQDVLFRFLQNGDTTGTNGLDTRSVSLFTVLSSTREFDNYTITTHLGFGSGKINDDSHLYVSNPKQNIGVFLGFNFKTPILKKYGGISFLTEFDGNGLNIGAHIPILNSTHINIAITHFEDFGDFGTEDDVVDWRPLSGDAPSITFGIGINLPRIYNPDNKASRLNRSFERGIYAKTNSSILYYDPICADVVETLRDSIRTGKNMIDNLDDFNNMLQHNEAVLVDSTRNSLLREQVAQSNQNKAMRHLSRSLRYFYNEQYRVALSEVNMAIELNPNLAIAYGRRGSIYYKLGDKRRATLNWNAALQLDPEFTEIYNILQAADENRLRHVKIGKTQENFR